jgi:hypothetical protein
MCLQCHILQVWRAYEAARHKADQGYWWTATKRRAAKRWLVTLVIGVLTGLIAILVTKGTNALTDFKFNTVSVCVTCINLTHMQVCAVCVSSIALAKRIAKCSILKEQCCIATLKNRQQTVLTNCNGLHYVITANTGELCNEEYK